MKSITGKIRYFCSVPAYIVGWLIFPLIVFVCLGVLGAKLGINEFVSWEKELPLMGSGITLNSLLDLQWYIFALLVLFGGVCSYVDNQHVKVDLFSGAFSRKTKCMVNLFGDVVFLAPFMLIIIFYGTKFAYSSFLSGEGSTYGGLQDRWVIKACLPIAGTLLLLAVISRVVDSIRVLLGKSEGVSPGNDDHD